LIFFTQGIRDLDYIKSLEIFKQNKNRFTIIRDLKGFEDCLDKQNTVYIGTRLHGGVCAMQQGIKSLVISIDNRAQEIHKDVNLPVIKRGDQKGLSEWIEGQLCFGEISLNLTNIDKWKAQFKPEKQT
jgi:polysaccharide pyruvyl transferase WcaK-like protein